MCTYFCLVIILLRHYLLVFFTFLRRGLDASSVCAYRTCFLRSTSDHVDTGAIAICSPYSSSFHLTAAPPPRSFQPTGGSPLCDLCVVDIGLTMTAGQPAGRCQPVNGELLPPTMFQIRRLLHCGCFHSIDRYSR